MILLKLKSFFVKSNFGPFLNKNFIVNYKSLLENVVDKVYFRFFKTMPINYISEYLDKKEYTILPSKAQISIPNSKYLKEPNDITPDMLLSQEKRNEFMSYFPGILQQLEEKVATFDDIEHGKHITDILKYIVPDGNKYVGVMVAETYKMLLPTSDQTSENIKLGYYLGWILELIIENYLIVDDILDGSTERRKKTCWYLLEDVQLAAINDAHLIEAGSYYLLRKNFGHLDCYMKLLEYIQDTSLMVYIGQHVELKFSKDAFNSSIELYRSTVNTISANIASYLPVVLAMTLAGYTDTENLKKARSILTQLGFFYLIENDYMECIKNPQVTKKPGRDIQTGRCRWPIVAFLDVATLEQKQLMKAHYGQDNDESVKIVKQLLDDINIHEIYAQYSAELYHNLMRDIEENTYGDMKKVYLKLIESLTCSTNCGGLFP